MAVSAHEQRPLVRDPAISMAPPLMLSEGAPTFKGLQEYPLTRVLRASDLKTMMCLKCSEFEKLESAALYFDDDGLAPNSIYAK